MIEGVDRAVRIKNVNKAVSALCMMEGVYSVVRTGDLNKSVLS
jgi:hypothetical protein